MRDEVRWGRAPTWSTAEFWLHSVLVTRCLFSKHLLAYGHRQHGLHRPNANLLQLETLGRERDRLWPIHVPTIDGFQTHSGGKLYPSFAAMLLQHELGQVDAHHR